MSRWTIETTKVEVNRILREFFTAQKAAAKALDKDYYRLWNITEQFVMTGGKRLRPYLCVMAYQAFGGKDPRKIVKVATAQELLHVCLLIHDDIIDHDYIRYGVANVAGRYQQMYKSGEISVATTDHLASGAALLAGDLLLSSSYGLVAESPLPPDKILQAQRHLQQAMFHVAGGELLDTEAVLRKIPSVNTRKIMELKTAQYSFIAPLITGAALADAKERDLQRLTTYGNHLGVAFQLVDDILGVFGDEAAIGKSTLGDLKESKRTYLLQTTLKMADPPTKAYLLSTVGARKVTKQDITKIRRIMIKTGALAYIQDIAHQQAALAAQLVDNMDISKTAKQDFQALTQKVTDTTRRSINSFT